MIFSNHSNISIQLSALVEAQNHRGVDQAKTQFVPESSVEASEGVQLQHVPIPPSQVVMV